METVSVYKYLGIYFSSTGSFSTNRKYLVQQATKALYYFYRRVNNLNLPPDLVFKLFDHTILPILLFSSEVWGYEDHKFLEKLHCAFLRKVLHLKQSTPYYMLYAETGRFPLEIMMKTRMIAYWSRLIAGNQSKIAYKIYQIMIHTTDFNSKWIEYIKSILNGIGRSDIWINQSIYMNDDTHKIVKKILIDQYQQQWNNNLQKSTKGSNYGLFKDKIVLENYLTSLPKKDYLTLAKFRTTNHYLPIETGRWRKIHISERKCPLCVQNDTGDEIHYLLKCPFFNTSRASLIKKYYYKRPNIVKFQQLMNCKSVKHLKNLCKLINIITSYFKN